MMAEPASEVSFTRSPSEAERQQERIHAADPPQIGPGQPCSHCGGEYGFHEGGCRNRRIERQHDQHGPVKSGAVFEKPGAPSRVDRRSGLPTDLALHELRGELGRVLTAIRRHRDQRGDDRCWLDDRELYAVLPEGYTPPAEDSCVELERCQQYIRCRHDPATTYVSPQRRIEELEAALAVADRHCEERLAFQQSEHEALVRGLRERVRELEALLAAKDRFQRQILERMQAMSEALGRVAEGEAVYEPPSVEELRQWEGELT